MKKLSGLFLVFLLAACVGTSQPSKFYSLKPLDSAAGDTYKNKLSIGIDEVKIPNYLDKPQIVTASQGSVELNVSEFNRWSESLTTMLQRVIANDMSFYLPNSVVKPRNYHRESFDYVVYVEINKLDGSLKGEASLDAWWTVLDKNKQLVLRERTELKVPTGSSYDDLVLSESNLVNQLSQQIAQKIARLRK